MTTLKNREFVFDEPAECIIGRAADCDIQIPTDNEHVDVSRHHCVLEIHPPHVQVRDLGSLNGTLVNGPQDRPAAAESTVRGERVMALRRPGAETRRRIARRPYRLPRPHHDRRDGTAGQLLLTAPAGDFRLEQTLIWRRGNP